MAARDPGGALHRPYGVQSPESWFEDFGSAQLQEGGATAFTLREAAARVTKAGGGAASAGIRFSYRVVAKHEDITAVRFEPLAEPPATVPAMPDLSPTAGNPSSPPPARH